MRLNSKALKVHADINNTQNHTIRFIFNSYNIARNSLNVTSIYTIFKIMLNFAYCLGNF